MSLAFPVAQPPDNAALEAGRYLFAQEAKFLKGVVEMGGLPLADRVEVCFAGRSNAGKSTLINALTGRKGLARASNTPGRTQEINYFALTDALYLVDLPGYGFAKAPASAAEAWQHLMRAYLAGRQTLRRAFILIDARHGIKPVDADILRMLDKAAVAFQIVLTKIDKLKSGDLEKVLDKVRRDLAGHPAAFPELAVTSSDKGTGIESLRSIIAAIP